MAKSSSSDQSKKNQSTEKPAKRQSRLGRGLSSLMAKPVKTAPPPAEPQPNPPANQARPAPTPQPKPISGPVENIQPATNATAPDVSRDTRMPSTTAETTGDDPGSAKVRYLPITRIAPNPLQPRQQFEEATLAQLADSIKSAGLMQPIIVRPDGDVSRETTGERTYQIVAGERRWRAAGKAGLAIIPAIVRQLDDREVAEWALIENLQREDLNPMERAVAFKNLTDKFGLSHEDIARQIGIDRSSVSNFLRLLNLDESVQQLVRQGMLSMGQARAIASLTNTKLQKGLASQAVREDWSVRRTEQAVRNAGEGDLSRAATAGSRKAPVSPRSSHLRDLEKQIGEQLQTKVKIKAGKKKGTGTLSIDFYSLEQFDALTEKLGVKVE